MLQVKYNNQITDYILNRQHRIGPGKKNNGMGHAGTVCQYSGRRLRELRRLRGVGIVRHIGK